MSSAKAMDITAFLVRERYTPSFGKLVKKMQGALPRLQPLQDVRPLMELEPPRDEMHIRKIIVSPDFPCWMYQHSTPSSIPADRHHYGGVPCGNNPFPIDLLSISTMWFA